VRKYKFIAFTQRIIILQKHIRVKYSFQKQKASDDKKKKSQNTCGDYFYLNIYRKSYKIMWLGGGPGKVLSLCTAVIRTKIRIMVVTSGFKTETRKNKNKVLYHYDAYK